MGNTKMKVTRSELLELLKEQTETQITNLSLEDKLADLGIDSMAFVMLVYEIEEKFNIEIDSSELDKFDGDVKVVDVVNMLNSKGIEIEDA